MKSRIQYISIMLITLLLFGCASKNTTINKNYDFNNMKRIGVTKFSNQNEYINGIEDLFSKYLMNSGYDVIDKKNTNNYNDIDVLLKSKISYFQPGKIIMGEVRTNSTTEEPKTTTITSNSNSNTSITKIETSSREINKESERIPVEYTTSSKLGIVVKLVDVKTKAIVWIGSVSKSGDNPLNAADNAAKYLVKKLNKDIKSVTKSIRNKLGTAPYLFL